MERTDLKRPSYRREPIRCSRGMVAWQRKEIMAANPNDLPESIKPFFEGARPDLERAWRRDAFGDAQSILIIHRFERWAMILIPGYATSPVVVELSEISEKMPKALPPAANATNVNKS